MIQRCSRRSLHWADIGCAAVVPHHHRAGLLISLANQLSNEPSDDEVREALAHTLTEGPYAMLTADIIHRLDHVPTPRKLRAHSSCGRFEVGD